MIFFAVLISEIFMSMKLASSRIPENKISKECLAPIAYLIILGEKKQLPDLDIHIGQTTLCK